MEAIRQEIRDELVRVRVDKVRLYNLLEKIVDAIPAEAPVAAPVEVPVEALVEVPVEDEKPKVKTTTKKKTTTRASTKKE